MGFRCAEPKSNFDALTVNCPSAERTKTSAFGTARPGLFHRCAVLALFDLQPGSAAGTRSSNGPSGPPTETARSSVAGSKEGGEAAPEKTNVPTALHLPFASSPLL